MNKTVLQVEITPPELRYTSDNQTPIVEFYGVFDPLREEDSLSNMKLTAFGKLAETIASTYKGGESLIVEGSLRMNKVDNPEGYKETVAEMVLSKVHNLGKGESEAANEIKPAELKSRKKPVTAKKETGDIPF